VHSWGQMLAELAGDRLMSLKRHAFLLCGNESQAEDLVQDALVRAFGRPLRAPRPDAAEAYVRVIMTHMFIDEARRRTRWNRLAPLLRGAELTVDPADELVDRDLMLAAMNDLSPRQRACVVLRYYQDLPVAQVAAELGLAEGTVKRCLSDAMTRLADRLSPAASGERRRDDTDGC
jgi:RNA polymerase sigma factor (sigma-70 family)